MRFVTNLVLVFFSIVVGLPANATTRTFSDSGFSFVADLKVCDRAYAVRGELKIPGKSLVDGDMYANHAALRRIAEQVVSNCPGVHSLGYTIRLPGGAYQRGSLSARHDWMPNEIRYAEQKQAQERARLQQEFLVNFAKEAPVPDHGLRDYGYYNAKLLGEEQGAALYVAAKTQRDRLLEFVLVHSATDGQPIIETKAPDEQQVIRPGDSYYEMLQRMIGDTPVVQQRVLHHYKGYHHPQDDRLRVLGPNFSETPIFTSQFLATFQRGKLVVKEHDRYSGIGFDTPTQQALVTLERVIERFGESAPVDSNAKADVQVALGPEGPSDEYLAKQASVRDKALKMGLIYKNDAFWSQFPASDIRAIFHGYDNGYGMAGFVGRTALMRYLNRNSQECSPSIVDPQRFKLEERVTETDEFGNSSSYTNTIWDMTVPGRFIPILDKNFNQPDNAGARQAASQIWNMLQPGGLRASAQDLATTAALVRNTQDSVDKLFKPGACDDPLKLQLEEMLYQLSRGQGPVTASSLKFDNAAALSDPLYKRGDSKTITEACLATFDFPNRERTTAYCSCIDRYIQRRAPDRVATYSKRYRKLTRDFNNAKTAMERGQEHPDFHIFAAMRSSCVRR